MTNNSQENDLSFLEKKDANALSGKDIFYTIIRNLHWLLLFGAIGAAIAFYKSDRADRVYESHAKIMIKSITRNRLDNGASMLENITNRRVATTMNAINDEIIVLKSETPMIEVAKNLDLGTTYRYKTKLVKRTKDLYKESPITVEFPDLKETDYATISVTVSRDSSIQIGIGELEPVKGRLGDTLSTQIGRVAVRPTWALRELFYDNPITVSHLNIYDVANSYRNRVNIARNSTSDGIINFSLHDTSPIRAADILNEMIRVYNDNTVLEKKDIINQTSEYINSRIAQLNSELGAKESQIASFKKDNQLLNLQDYGQAYMQQSIQSSEELEKLQAQISHAQYLLQFTNSNSENKLFPMTINIEDENIKKTIARFNELVLKLDKYKESGTTNNPIVQDMRLEQATLKSNLNQLLSSYIGAISQRMATAQGINQMAAAKISQVPTGQLYIDNISRVQGIKEQLYLTLLSKREELLISQPSIEGNAKVIDKARINRSPVAPNTKKNMLIGLLIGLLIPLLFFVIRRIMDTKIRYRKDVEGYVNIPILGEIPSKEKGDTRDIVIVDKKRDAISEAFRILRSNIDFTRNTEGGATSYLFISLMESSGKTFITSNLAASLALVEKKVILLDLDLRKGTLTHKFAHRSQVGFSNYLSGKTNDIEEIIRHDIIAPGVDTILSGPIPPNPAELLSSRRLDDLFKVLRERYDYIIIDAQANAA